MGGQQHADAALPQSRHGGPDGDPPLGVDARRGFVEEGDLGPADERQRERQALLLAAREVAPGGGSHGGQAHQVEQALRRQGVGVVGAEEVEDPARPEHRVDAAPLEHDADAARQRGMVGHRVEPEHPHHAAGGPPVALERLDGRGLARPVGAEDDEDLAGLRPQVQLVDRGGRAGRSVAHGEAGDLEGWHGVAGYFEQE